MKAKMKKLIRYPLVYLSTPYTKYKDGLDQAYIDASRIAARLLMMDVKIYSPIAHGHSLSMYGGINPLDHSIWMPFNQAMMDKSDAILVAKLNGWEESKGVIEEIRDFRIKEKPIYYLNPTTLMLEEPDEAAQLVNS